MRFILPLILFGIALWYLIGFVWMIIALIPMLIATVILFFKEVVYAWKNADKFKAAEERRREFLAEIDRDISRHNETFADVNDVDENGIPYL